MLKIKEIHLMGNCFSNVSFLLTLLFVLGFALINRVACFCHNKSHFPSFFIDQFSLRSSFSKYFLSPVPRVSLVSSSTQKHFCTTS